MGLEHHGQVHGVGFGLTPSSRRQEIINGTLWLYQCPMLVTKGYKIGDSGRNTGLVTSWREKSKNGMGLPI